MKIDSNSHWKINNKTKEKTKQKRKIDEIDWGRREQIIKMNIFFINIAIAYYSLFSVTAVN